jgi:hypothetical protein
VARQRLFAAICMIIVVAVFNPCDGVKANEPKKAARDNAFAVTTADKGLFLLQALEHTYGTWPVSNSHPAFLRMWIAETRLNLTRLKKDGSLDKVDPDTLSLYDDALRLLDEYDTFLTNLGISTLRTPKPTTSFAPSISAGTNAAFYANSLVGPLPAAAAGAVTFGGNALYDFYVANHEGKEIDDSRKRFLDDISTQINGRFQAALAGAEVVARRKTEENNWVGSPTFQFSKSMNLVELAADRPHDPFLAVRAAAFRAATTIVNDRELDTLSDQCVSAAKQVPVGPVYDLYRAGFLLKAANLRALASEIEIIQSGGSFRPAPSAAGELELYDRVRRILGDADFNDQVQGDYLRALMHAGRFEDAKSIMDTAEALKTNPIFAYDYARVLSRLGHIDLALQWLRKHLEIRRESYGWWIRDDADLQPLRTYASGAFFDLVEPQFTWKIKNGVLFGATLELTNKSPFRFTHVAAKPVASFEVLFGKPQYINKVFQVDELLPGATKQWDVGTSVPDDAISDFVLTCDQNRVYSARAAGPVLHQAGQDKYLAAPYQVRFWTASGEYSSTSGDALPSREDIRRLDKRLTGNGHVANTSYFRHRLERGTLFAARYEFVDLDLSKSIYVCRAADGTWHQTSEDLHWQDYSRGSAGTFYRVPGYEISVDVVRPEAGPDPDDNLNYRFCAVANVTAFPKVSEVTSGGVAERAGVHKDDLILDYDGIPVAGTDHLTSLVEHSRPQDIRLRLLRNRSIVRLTVPGGTPLDIIAVPQQ